MFVCVCVCVGGVFYEGECKSMRRKKGWGERDKHEKERGHIKEGERNREESEVVLGGGGCWSVEMSVAH